MKAREHYQCYVKFAGSRRWDCISSLPLFVSSFLSEPAQTCNVYIRVGPVRLEL